MVKPIEIDSPPTSGDSASNNWNFVQSFSTQYYLYLRLYIRGDNFFHPLFRIDDVTLEKMKILRATVLSSVAPLKYLDALQSFIELWRILPQFPVEHPLYMPPLYLEQIVISQDSRNDDNSVTSSPSEASSDIGQPSDSDTKHKDQLYNVIKFCVVGLLRREAGCVSTNNNSGHILLSGIKGVGKSTVLRALSIGAAILLDRMVPITWSYDMKASWPASPIPDVTQLVDEFVFYLTEEKKRVLNRAVVSPHRDMGRQRVADNSEASDFHSNREEQRSAYNAEVEISFSYLENQRRQARGPRGEKDFESSYNLLASQSFNGLKQEDGKTKSSGLIPFFSLDEFQNLYIPKIASKSESVCDTLYNFCRYGATFAIITGSSSKMKSLMFLERPPSWMNEYDFPNFNHTLFTPYTVEPIRSLELLRKYVKARYSFDLDNVEKLLYYTGGVGRDIDSFAVFFVPAPISGFVCLPSDSDCNEIASRHSRLYDSCFDDLVLLVVSMLEAVYPNTLRRIENKPLPSCVSIERSAILMDVTCAQQEFLSKIDDFVDNGIFYSGTDGSISFLRPFDIELFDKYVLNNKSEIGDRLVLRAIQWMVQGIKSTSFSGQEYIARVNSGRVLEDLVFNGMHKLLPHPSPQLDHTWEITMKKDNTEAKKISFSVYVQQIKPTRGALQLLTPDILTEINGALVHWKGEAGLDGLVIEVLKKSLTLHCWQCKGGGENEIVTPGNLDTQMDNMLGNRRVDDGTFAGIIVKAFVGIHRVVNALYKVDPGRPVTKATLSLTTNKQVLQKSWKNRPQVPKISTKILQPMGLSKLPKEIAFDFFCNSGLQWIFDALPKQLSKSSEAKWLKENEDSKGGWLHEVFPGS